MRTVPILVLLSCCLTAHADLVQSVTTLSNGEFVELAEGRNKTSDSVEDYTSVTRTDDGFLIEAMTFSDRDRLAVYVDWEGDPDLWYRLTVDRMELNGQDLVDTPFESSNEVEEFFTATRIGFHPWRNPEGPALIDTPRTYVFPHNSDSLRVSLTPIFELGPPPEGNHIVFEYSLEQLPVPMPADFNYDETVDFLDFVILSKNFGADAFEFFRPTHFRGDADHNGTTNFEDFQILRETFGDSRIAANNIATVPEPDALPPLLVIVAVLFLRQWARRLTVTPRR